MEGIVCDRCGRALLVDHEVRYVAEIKVYAAYDPLEVTREDLKAAGDSELWQRLVEQIRARSAEELEAEVFKRFEFDLCPPCQRAFLANPLPPAEPDEAAPSLETQAEHPPDSPPSAKESA